MDEKMASSLSLVTMSLQSFTEKLRGDDGVTGPGSSGFSLTEFWDQLQSLCEVLSHEITKFGMIFTSGVTPSTNACDGICERLIGMSAALFKTVTSLPVDTIGVHLRRSLYNAAEGVFSSICSTVNAVKENPNDTKTQLKEIGTVWESFDRLKNIPKNSREFLLSSLTRSSNMVNDALSEIQEFSTAPDTVDDQEEEKAYSEQEKIQLNACIHLVKAAKAVLNKFKGSIEQSKVDVYAAVSDDGELTATIEGISPSVDDAVTAIYDREDPEALRKEVTRLRSTLQEALCTFHTTSYYEDSHLKWLDLLRTAIDHNFTKFCKSCECTSS